MTIARPAIERLLPRLKFRPSGCLEWTGPVFASGYGTMNVDPEGTKMGVHRVAYEVAKGPIPKGLVIDHLCKNPRCCNAAHMEAVTTRENVRRRTGGRDSASCAHGHPRTPENTIVRKGGRVNCRPCKQEQERVRRLR